MLTTSSGLHLASVFRDTDGFQTRSQNIVCRERMSTWTGALGREGTIGRDVLEAGDAIHIVQEAIKRCEWTRGSK